MKEIRPKAHIPNAPPQRCATAKYIDIGNVFTKDKLFTGIQTSSLREGNPVSRQPIHQMAVSVLMQLTSYSFGISPICINIHQANYSLPVGHFMYRYMYSETVYTQNVSDLLYASFTQRILRREESRNPFM